MLDRLRDEIRKLFFLTRSEANGYLILIVVMCLLLLTPFVLDLFVHPKPFQSAEDKALADSLIVAWNNANQSPNSKTKAPAQHNSSTAQLYLEPAKKPLAKKVATHPSPPFDINSADTTLLKKIYGIGPVLSERIVKFRDKLGGFYTTDQLYEVYGLDSSVVSRLLKRCFISDTFQVQKIHLNTSSFKEVNTHPYISYEQTKAILNYRRKHDAFNRVDDLKTYELLDSTTYQKALPYLAL